MHNETSQVTASIDIETFGKPKPVLKEAGGKQQLIKDLHANAPQKYNKYIDHL